MTDKSEYIKQEKKDFYRSLFREDLNCISILEGIELNKISTEEADMLI